jgi:hypothetical protein
MSDQLASADRIEKLLALLLLHNLKGMPQRDKAVQLSMVGFSNVEIADLLQTSAAVISQYLYEVRKKKKKS